MASWIDAYNVKIGTSITIDGVACAVKSIDVSKSGKHGASKCRIEAVGIVDDKKRIVAVPGSERFEVPMIEKRRAQVLSFDKIKGTASVMDLESFETIEVKVSEDILKDLEENRNVEYWIVDEKKIVKRLA
jgi:translation initiation factor 5A